MIGGWVLIDMRTPALQVDTNLASTAYALSKKVSGTTSSRPDPTFLIVLSCYVQKVRIDCLFVFAFAHLSILSCIN
jgi:hypothetical protein